MAVWAIADLHLSFGVPDKEMHVFGENWRNHPDKIKNHWESCITKDDLVLIAGDISWGKYLGEALPDLNWIDKLPGTKVMIRGNHDYWWEAISKVRSMLPPSIHCIQNDVFNWNDVSVGGARLWDTSEFGFDDYVIMTDAKCVKPLTEKDLDPARAEKIYARELMRLETSLKKLHPRAAKRLVMTHYPPVNIALDDSRASALLEKYRVDICVFGHIHNMKHDKGPIFGEKKGLLYVFTAADYLDFMPVRIL